jgi:hypothetical protein
MFRGLSIAYSRRSRKIMTKSPLSSAVRFGARWIRNCLESVPNLAMRPIMSERTQRQRIFRDIYEKGIWGKEEKCAYYSGDGSRGEAATIYVDRMGEFLERHIAEIGRAITVIDLGCGDFQIGRALTMKIPNLIYIGCDIVPMLIAHNTKSYATKQVSFRHLDIVTDPLPEGDIYLVRQVFQHLGNAEIMSVLRRARCKYLYVTEGHPAERIGPVNPDKATSADVRFDRRTGRGRGVELDQKPYCVPTREMFRAYSSPKEVIITELVTLSVTGDR